ncbi:MAG TPA: TonB-dependent receptor [Gammaproteobacteria bacterium]|nr:TonB-dependent receptor [Gammaproteobacteria bacterium]
MNRVSVLGRFGSVRCGLLLLPVYFFASVAMAEECAEKMATIISIQGTVEKRQKSGTVWEKVTAQDTFCVNDMVRTQMNSRAALYLNNNSILRLNELSTVIFTGPSLQDASRLDLRKGIAHFISRIKQRFEVLTPYVNAAVDGTEFVVAVDADQTRVTVLEGRVRVSNEQGEINLTQGETALAQARKAPALQTRVKPWNEVSWALYYPAVSDFSTLVVAAEELPEPWRARLLQSVEHYQLGRASAALTELEALPDDILNGNIYVYRAALYLAAGQDVQASMDLERALKRDAGNGEALALKSVIAVTQNRADQAVTLAREATDASPKSAATWLAYSYAQQAVFDLKQARLSVKQAVRLAPENALAWARLAELHLMFGELDQALWAARRAAEIAPRLARTQSVLGFAYLTQIKIAAAERAFNQAIKLDQAAPLPRLGLGLAMIRRGELASGRRQIEIAASLAPANSLIRSYLGKAYYEEKRGPLDATQFAMAKELDPNDPTPWFYDAIRKQTENDPVGALQDLNKSIELNDNRAVYRSSFLLDSDEAARSVSQSRIYKDLGFEQRSLLEGWRSLIYDPSNYSAHRLLADSYSNLPQHEIARVSELLQSQLLQPINANPIQPQLAESNLGILDGAGPSGLGLNEFNPLFIRNSASVQMDFTNGSNGTSGDSLILSGIQNDFSFSFGKFRYETDGFRENNDAAYDIYNFFAQARVSNRANIQFEYRDTERNNGDVRVNTFRPESFKPTLRERTETDLFRVGLNYKLNPNAVFLASLATNSADFVSSDFESGLTRNDEGDSVELVYLGNYATFNTVSGIGSFKGSTKDKLVLYEDPAICILIGGCEKSSEETIRHNNFFFYAYLDLDDKGSKIITGLTVNDVKNDLENDSFVNPKLGAIININRDNILRFAAFKTTKRDLVNNQTLEPTQIAGFNQFFDDSKSAESRLYGIGYDTKMSGSTYAGLNYYNRTIDFSFINGDVIDSVEWTSKNGGLYVYSQLDDNFNFSAEFQFDRFEAPTEFNTGILELNTFLAPVSLRYFNSNGLSANITVVHVNQDGKFFDSTIPPFGEKVNDNDNFIMTNVSMGYRLPKRLGILTLEVNNLTDKKYKFQDIQASPAIFSPERYVIGKFTLNLQ